MTGSAAGLADSLPDMRPWCCPRACIASGEPPTRPPKVGACTSNGLALHRSTMRDGLLERDAELAALDSALEAAIGGRGSVVAVEGPPGIGKSRLVNAALDLARERGMYTISVRATELERSYPYGIVRQTADSVQLDKSEEDRAALFTGAAKLALPILDPGGEETADNPELMYQRLHGLYWLIANLAREQPLLIAIDDAQWADEASMAAERFLSLRIARPADGAAAGGAAPPRWASSPCRWPRSSPTRRRSRSGRARSRPRAPGTASSRCSARATRTSPPPATTPPAATPSCSSSWCQRDPRRGHRAERRQRRARVLARAGHGAGVGAAAARAAAERGRPGGARARGARRARRDDQGRGHAGRRARGRGGRSARRAGALRARDRARRTCASPTRSCARRSRTTCRPSSARAPTSRRRGCSPTATRTPWPWPPTCWCASRARASGRAPRSARAARRAEALGDPSAAVRYLERAVAERPEDDELGEILFELGLAAAHAGDPDAGRAPGARGRGRRAHAAAGAALDRGAPPRGGPREQGGRRARVRARATCTRRTRRRSHCSRR